MLLSCSYLRKPLNHRYLSIPACKFKKFGVFRNLCGVLFNSRGCRTSQLKQLKSYDRRKEFFAFPKCRKKSSSDLSLHFPAHRAASTKQWHERHGVKLFGGWPGNSPDLNPIEFLESNEAHAKKRASDFSRGTKTNRTQSLEGCFLRLPQKALRVYAKAHAGDH